MESTLSRKIFLLASLLNPRAGWYIEMDVYFEDSVLPSQGLAWDPDIRKAFFAAARDAVFAADMRPRPTIGFLSRVPLYIGSFPRLRAPYFLYIHHFHDTFG